MSHWSKGTKLFPWYDAEWLGAFETARRRIRERDPAALANFEAAFSVLRTPADFSVKCLEAPLPPGDLASLRGLCREISVDRLEAHELSRFGRFVAHDQPLVTEAHQRLVPLVSGLVGEEVEASYNFLSLYTDGGALPPHLDDPRAKYTLDVCLNTSVDWPIFVSEPKDWPRAGELSGAAWEQEAKASSRFGSYVLKPGSGILFSGSAQWHYRDPFPKTGGGDFCDLVFFHFRPKGSGRLTDPSEWPSLFGRADLFPSV